MTSKGARCENKEELQEQNNNSDRAPEWWSLNVMWSALY